MTFEEFNALFDAWVSNPRPDQPPAVLAHRELLFVVVAEHPLAALDLPPGETAVEIPLSLEVLV